MSRETVGSGRRRAIAALVLATSIGAGRLAAQDAPADAQGDPGQSGQDRTVLLDTYSYWRTHVTLRPIPFGTQGESAPHVQGTHAIGFSRSTPTMPIDQPHTPFPPPDWSALEFDDSNWWRDPGPYFGGSPWVHGHRTIVHYNRFGVEQPSTLALMCLRGKFTVADPARVRDLAFSAEFRGGLRVLLNGNEVGRFFLPDGAIGPETLADDYPLEVSLDEGNRLLPSRGRGGRDLEEGPITGRVRRVERAALPVGRLRRGTNVLALEIHRAAMPTEILAAARPGRGFGGTGWYWNTVGLLSAELSADGDGAIPNTARPPGVQVWNAGALKSLFESDYGDPHEPLRPIRIVAARNGRFSGQVVVSSRAPIRGLLAEMGPLRHVDSGTSIPPDAVAVRYASADVPEVGARFAGGPVTGRTAPRPRRFHALLDEPPDELAVQSFPSGPGAVQPIWVTVRVSADAAPGDYEGTLRIRFDRTGEDAERGASGAAPPVSVSVRLTVSGWTLPDPARFATWVDFIQSPDNLAEHYKVPPWSDRHWELIGASMRLLAQAGSRTLYLPLIARTNLGNSQTMVRWIAADDGYRHDFSIAERYLDLARDAGLTPEVVALQVWDYHVGYNMRDRIGTGGYSQPRIGSTAESTPVPVTGLNPRTGETFELSGPANSDPGASAFWQPVARGMRERLVKRGLGEALMLGLVPDGIPTRDTVELWGRLLPGVPWVTMAHGAPEHLYDAPVAYSTTVFKVRYAIDPELERNLGWKRPERIAYFPRGGAMPLASDRVLFETGLTGDTRGAGRLALDFFVFRNRFDSNWGSLTLGPAWAAPGPHGPVWSTRLEMGVEGVQECEARIFIERALHTPALRAAIGDELAERVQAVLDERTRAIAWAQEKHTNGVPQSPMPGGPIGFEWYADSGWEDRAARLFDAAAEIRRAIGGR